jgi:tRNA(Ile)-lysidine synthase
MLRSMDILRSEETYLGRQADDIYHRVTKQAGKGISLDIRELLKYDIALVRRIIRRAIQEVRSDLHGIEYQHIDQIVDLGNKKTGKVVFLPGGLVVEREYGQLRLHPVETEGCSFDIVLPLNRELVLSESGIKVKASVVKSMRERHRIFQAPHHMAYFDLDRVHRPLRLRCRRKGDIFLMFDGHRKKVKDVFIDRKMTRRERQLIPLLVDRRSILWIVGVARSGWAKVTPATKRILVVKTENTY